MNETKGWPETAVGAPALDIGSTNYARIRDALRADIIASRLTPGMRLKVQELAKRYNVSAMPIREALQQLQGEGLVIMSPNRGASVRRVDEQYIRNTFELWEAVESFLTKKFVMIATDEDIGRLRRVQDAFDAAVARGDLPERLALNRRFHETINGTGGNRDALALLGRLCTASDTFRHLYGHSVERISAIQQEHRQIIDAIVARNSELASAISGQHLRNARDDLLRLFSNKD